MENENILNEVQYSAAYHNEHLILNVFAHFIKSWDIDGVCDGVASHVDSQGLRELYKGISMVSPYKRLDGYGKVSMCPGNTL